MWNSRVTGNVAMNGTGVFAGREIVNSTIARNHGRLILRFNDSGYLANTTVAVNSAGSGIVTNPAFCFGAITTPRLMLESSIAALNRCGSNYAIDIVAGPIIGSHNLVQYSRSALPADTLRVNPKLQSYATTADRLPRWR